MRYEGLGDGAHRFEVLASDVAGRRGEAAVYEWVVDATAPQVVFVAAPPVRTFEDRAHFEFECTNEGEGGCAFECALSWSDVGGEPLRGEWEACESGHTLEALQPGDYTLHVRASDAAGNVGAADHAWTFATDGWADVATGYEFACGVRATGTLWCWGRNEHGQLGQGGAQRERPVQVGADSDWTAVSAGNAHTCGLRATGELWCWGQNTRGALGLGDLTDRDEPAHVQPGSEWSAVAAGESYTCGVQSGGLLCWGDSYTGQLGDGALRRDYPVRVPDPEP